VGRTTGGLKEAIIKLSKAAKEIGFTINPQKTKYTEVTKLSSTSRMIKVDEQEFERVNGFKYLGSTLTEDNSNNIAMKHKIVMANLAIYGSRNN
jgi:hypothetical protein